MNPPVSEYPRVTTVEDLDTLDDDEIVEGYRDAWHGEPAPGNNRSRSYHHGYGNGWRDRNHVSDRESMALARAVVRRLRLS